MTDAVHTPAPRRRSRLRRAVAALFGRATTPPDALAALWQALGRSPEDCTEPGQDPWQAALAQVRRQREDLLQNLQLQLQLTTTRAEAQMTAAVLAALQDGVVVLDRTERVLFANETARRVLQITDQDGVMRRTQPMPLDARRLAGDPFGFAARRGDPAIQRGGQHQRDPH